METLTCQQESELKSEWSALAEATVAQDAKSQTFISNAWMRNMTLSPLKVRGST